MKLGVIKEKAVDESRVAVTPDVIALYKKLGVDVLVEQGAGVASGFSDDAYKKAGAKVSKGAAAIIKQSDIIARVQPPSPTEISHMKSGSLIVGFLGGSKNKPLVKKLASKKMAAFAVEYIPRISRAQSMDALSSQSNLAGYKAVIDAVAEFGKVLPMMMTAAGRIDPANVLVLGAGVAGLQAIATAKRLGAVVSAFDVRPAVKEQVESLGAHFVEVEDDSADEAETKGGYAKEMSEDYKKKQAKLLEETIASQDIVITTALIPDKPAPKLISEKMVKSMAPGSVIVDLAAIMGGNCELTVKNKVTEKYGVKIIGYENVPARVPYNASKLYAKNLYNFLSPIIDSKSKKIAINLEDEVQQGALLCYEGNITK